jgi:nucleoside-diphosphate-sugar epimerase
MAISTVPIGMKSMKGSYIADNMKMTEHIDRDDFIVAQDDLILITGASGFIGTRVVESLLRQGFRNLRCFARSSPTSWVETLVARHDGARIEVFKGNLLSREDCEVATRDVAVIFHLAAGRGEKSFPDAFINSVVTTRNLLEACLRHKRIKRFVNISSFAVYNNERKPRRRLLDESCPVETHPARRGEAYCFAKVKQDELVMEYGEKFSLPYVIVRPGYVYGPGKTAITGRVGIDTFGFFMHMGGSNRIPFTYVENCADAIALAGLKKGVDSEVFNVVDDDLPSSRCFLRQYKKHVKKIKSIYVPHVASYALCSLWERYSNWSQGQLPPVFNTGRWHANWKKTSYSNKKLKTKLGWLPRISTTDGLRRYFEACKDEQAHA